MENRIRRVFRVLTELENLIVIIGVLVSAVLAYSGIKSGDIQQALTAILAVLGALAVAQIVASHAAARRDRRTEKILSLLQQAGISAGMKLPLKPRTELQPLPSRVPNAKDILIIGRSLSLVLQYTDFFRGRLREGATIRLVVINFNNVEVCRALAPLLETSVEGFAANVQSSIESAKRIAEAAMSPEQLEIRLIEFVPTLGLVIVDSLLPIGHILVELQPYQVGPASRPHFIIGASETPSWFTYFRDVGEHIWRDAIPM